jgi:hypothetical protein
VCDADGRTVCIGGQILVERRSVVSSLMGASSKMSVRVSRDAMRCLSSFCSLGGGRFSIAVKGSGGMEGMEEFGSM